MLMSKNVNIDVSKDSPIVECFIYLQVSACKLAINSAYFLDKKGNILIEK